MANNTEDQQKAVSYDLNSNKTINISMRDYEVLSSGSVILLQDDYVEFNIGSLRFRFEVEYNDEKKNSIKISLKGEEESQYQCITFINPTSGNGGAITAPIELAKIDTKKIKLIFTNQAMASDEENRINMLINYTWLIEK